MSGIVGILHQDGAPVDPQLLQRLTDFQRFRGPDAQGVWVDGPIGLGHTLLKTTDDTAADSQPLSLDGKRWIVADVRVDGRRELTGELAATGQQVSSNASDAELILRSYCAWGEGCLDHLLGDFSFAVWDAPRKRLFCARDHMGVKPLYYAHVGPLVVFSNTLDCIRQHPAISDRLNDLAIADFLLMDINQDAATTSFADIQRLPAAHVLACEGDRFSVRRYWSLSVTEEVRFKRDREYLERFRELLDQAVKDRLRTNSAGMMMSGGLDSPTVAATAKRLLAERGGAATLTAHTVVVDGLIHDEERHYAGIVADALNIPIEFTVATDCRLFEGALKPEFHTPEPEHSAWPEHITKLLQGISRNSRIALTGSGSDPGFSSRITVHFQKLIEKRQFVRAAKDAFRYLSAERRLSRLYLRLRWRMLFGTSDSYFAYPSWWNEDLENRLNLVDRWKTCEAPGRQAMRRRESRVHAFRPEAIVTMSHVNWQTGFESLDSGTTRVPVEIRHPFFDLRLVTFLLGLPRLPWCCDKEMLRRYTSDALPQTVRFRKKSPTSSDPTVALLQKPESAWVDRFEPAAELARYVRRERIPPVYLEKHGGAAWVNLRPLSLNFWLRGRR